MSGTQLLFWIFSVQINNKVSVFFVNFRWFRWIILKKFIHVNFFYLMNFIKWKPMWAWRDYDWSYYSLILFWCSFRKIYLLKCFYLKSILLELTLFLSLRNLCGFRPLNLTIVNFKQLFTDLLYINNNRRDVFSSLKLHLNYIFILVYILYLKL